MELLVLNYHYFREVKYKSGIYPISEDEFIKQVEYLDSHYKIISQEELREIVKSKKIIMINFHYLHLMMD